MEEKENEIMLLSGNKAAALAAYLAPVKYAAGYPITPSTPVIEELSKFAEKDDSLKFEICESEYSVMAKLIGAASVGARTFTATSGPGLTLMNEVLHIASYYALPIVMAVANRALGIWNIWSDQSDSISQLRTGWVQLYCKDVQEVFDSILLAYKIAENPDVLTPVMVCYDGFPVGQTEEPIIIPTREKIRQYLPELKLPHKISIDNPFTLGGTSCPHNSSEFQKDRMRRLNNVVGAAENAIHEFGGIFEREISPIIEINSDEYIDALTARNICVSMGGISGAVQEAVNKINCEAKNILLGTLRIKLFEPFPAASIRNLFNREEIRKIIVFNNSPHPVLTERIRSALYGAEKQPLIISRTIGIGGSHEVSSDFLADKIKEAIIFGGEDENDIETIWCLDPVKNSSPQTSLKTNKIESNDSEVSNGTEKTFIISGHRACAGCGAVYPMKWALEVLGEKTIVSLPASCWSVIASSHFQSCLKVPLIHAPFPAGIQIASGIKAVYESRGEKINAVFFGGDGAFFDIGFGAFSAAAERKEKIICICYDNEAYMNTGVQRSGATPFGAFTETSLFKKEEKKNLMEIMAAHKIPYAATAAINFRDDFKEKIKKAILYQNEGLCFIHILCPCPTGWKFPSDLTVEIARNAVLSGIFPLYEVDHGKYKLQKCYALNEEVLEQYLSSQGRFKNLTEKDKEIIKCFVQEKAGYLRKLAEMS